MKSLAKICLVVVTALTLSAYTAHAQADSTSTNKPPTTAKRAPQYNGTIASVDSDAKTITFTKANGTSQTIHITSKTKIKKDGEPATLADAAAGQKVRGAAHKDDSGNWVATTVNIGEMKKKTATTTPAAPAAPADKQ